MQAGLCFFHANEDPVMEPRSFFPHLDLGLDKAGRPRALKLVSIFRTSVHVCTNVFVS